MESSLFQSGNFDKISTSRMSYSDKFSTLTADKKEWLKNNLPVFAQPKIDVDNGYGLLGVFVSFDIAKNSVAGTSENRVHLRIIYKGEATYSRRSKRTVNRVGTLLYRTYNVIQFKRTTDIDQLCFEGVNFSTASVTQVEDDNILPWKSISTKDYNGSQEWNLGERSRFLRYYSFFHHYNLDAPFSSWIKFPEGDKWTRPIVIINTGNHLHGPEDRNPDLEKKLWIDYPVWEGDEQDAEMFGRFVCKQKINLLSWIRMFQRPPRNIIHLRNLEDLRLWNATEMIKDNNVSTVDVEDYENISESKFA